MKYVSKYFGITSTILEILIGIGIATNYFQSENWENVYLFWLWTSFFVMMIIATIVLSLWSILLNVIDEYDSDFIDSTKKILNLIKPKKLEKTNMIIMLSLPFMLAYIGWFVTAGMIGLSLWWAVVSKPIFKKKIEDGIARMEGLKNESI